MRKFQTKPDESVQPTDDRALVKKLQAELGIEDELLFGDESDLRWLKMLNRMDNYQKANSEKKEKQQNNNL